MEDWQRDLKIIAQDEEQPASGTPKI